MSDYILDDELEISTEALDKSGAIKRLLRYREMLNELVRVRDVNREELADLIIRAKGPRRSIRQFAMELGVNPSTLTRIINLQTTSASKDELILKIAEKADPDSGVTVKQLLEAHGVEIQKDENRTEQIIKVEKRMRQIILEDLITRGYTVSENEKKNNLYIHDLIVETSEGDVTRRWAFDFKAVRTHGMPVGIGFTSRWIDQAMASFYRGDAMVDKITLVVERRMIFEQIKERLSQYKIPDEMSVMLLGSNRIVDEYTVPRR